MLSGMFDRLNSKILSMREDERKALEVQFNDITFAEMSTFQDMQSQLYAAGVISLKDASMIHNAIGAYPSQETWATLDLTMKVFISTILPMVHKNWSENRCGM